MLFATYVYARSLITSQVSTYIKSGCGQALVEYGLLLALLVIVSIAAVRLVGVNVGALYNYAAPKVPS